MFGWIAAAFAAPLQVEAVAPFVKWHCSADNPIRYEGDLTLAPWPGLDAARRPVFVPASRWAEVGSEGIVGDRFAAYAAIAVDQSAPTAVVAEAFLHLAEDVPKKADRWLAFAAPVPSSPRPTLPLDEKATARFAAAERALAGLDAPQTLAYVGSLPGCDLDVSIFMGRADCERSAATLLATMAEEASCRRPEVLAAWSHATGGDGAEGVPVSLFSIGVTGPSWVDGDGPWADRAPTLVARPDLGMAPPPPPREAEASPAEFEGPKLDVKRRVGPVYPPEMKARAAELGDQRCMVTVDIDERGVPYDVEVFGCARGYHEAARTALAQWRWYPYLDNGSPIQVRTSILIIFRLT